MNIMHGFVNKIWGCYTTCDDRLIIEEIIEKNTKTKYFVVNELSIEINKAYTYTDRTLPQIIKDIIILCELQQSCVSLYNTKQTLYGPHILRKMTKQPIVDLELDYFKKEKEFYISHEDDKIKIFYKWLRELLNISM